jgi:hypothetical protein
MQICINIYSHTTGYRKRNFSLQNVPFKKEQVNGQSLDIQHTYIHTDKCKFN